jgi:hypothetical protein
VRLLNVLRLLASSAAPQAGVAAGAVYYDMLAHEPVFHDGTTWNTFRQIGFPDPVVAFTVPDGRQVTYFDKVTNDGVLTITGSGYLVGIR